MLRAVAMAGCWHTFFPSLLCLSNVNSKKSVDCLTYYRSIVNWLIEGLTVNCSIDCLIDCLIVRLIDWLIIIIHADLLLGVGISFTFATSTENPFPVKTTPLTLLSVSTLLASLVYSFVFVLISKFRLGRLYGFLLLGLYVVFLGLAIPTSLNVLF